MTVRYRLVASEFTSAGDQPRFYLAGTDVDLERGQVRLYDHADRTIGPPAPIEALLRHGMWAQMADDEVFVDLPLETPAVKKPMRRSRVPREHDGLAGEMIGGPLWTRSRSPLPAAILSFEEMRILLGESRGIHILVAVDPSTRALSRLAPLRYLSRANDEVLLAEPPTSAVANDALETAIERGAVRRLNMARTVQRDGFYKRGRFDVVFLSGFEHLAGMDPQAPVGLELPEDLFEGRTDVVVVDGAGPNSAELIDSLRKTSLVVGLTYPKADRLWPLFSADTDASGLGDCIVHILENLERAATKYRATGMSTAPLIDELRQFGKAISAARLTEDQTERLRAAVTGMLRSGSLDEEVEETLATVGT